MALRFSKRIRIAPGLTLNLSKSGISASVGVTGAKITIGPRGVRRTIGIPGTGLYDTEVIRARKGPAAPQESVPLQETETSKQLRAVLFGQPSPTAIEQTPEVAVEPAGEGISFGRALLILFAIAVVAGGIWVLRSIYLG